MATIQLTKHRLSSAALMFVPLMLAMVCSASADASCGDYLHSRRSLEVTSQPAPHRPETTVVNTRDVAEAPQGPVVPGPQPCSGPECGKAPLSIPLPVPVSFPGNHSDQHPAIFHCPRSERPANARWAGPFSAAHAVPGFPPAIDVPPEVLL